ncbi:MAG: hypothetical protein HGA39_07545 [Coriobacteriia bacterium]|nr:hypothetical protein [Coriobacteriia bacterium]
MLAQLKAQEPSENKSLWKMNLAAAGVIVVVGLLCSIWGTAAIAKSGGGIMGTITALVLLLTGLGFLGAGVKIGHRTLRQRGVL